MSSISGNNKIVLKAGYTDGGAEHEEGILTAAGTPGMNLAMSVTADSQMVNSWTPGSTDYAGTGTATTTKNPVRVLKEDILQGHTLDTAYASGDRCFLHICKPGDVIQVLVTSGQTISKGDGLSADGTGKFQHDSTNVAVEALEDSGGALGADTHMRVRVL